MILKRFLTLILFALLIQFSSYAQFTLVKDFSDDYISSFKNTYTGILYSIGTKVIVEYDSVAGGAYTSLASLSAVDIAGNSQRIASSELSTNDVNAFFDFKTLPDGKVAFIAIESASSYKVIITDGTTAGTTAVYSAAYPILGLEVIDNGLYFTYEGNPNHALMKVELATLTVSTVKTFGYFHMISDISKVSNTELIFMAPDATDDALNLYVSDGTAGGTISLGVINTSGDVTQNTVMTQVGNKVFFFYKQPGAANELWVTTGTVAGTKKLKDFEETYFKDFVRERKAIGFNDKFYFAGVGAGASVATDEVLWVSDGTTAGTIALMDPALKNIYPVSLTAFKNTLYFTTYDWSVYGSKLCKTNGTVAGTSVMNMECTNETIDPYDLATDGTYLYMGARNYTIYGTELFRYDGVHTQCDVLYGFAPGASSDPDNLYMLGTQLYLTADLPGNGNELYIPGGDFVSGIPTGTQSSFAVLCTVYPNPAKDQVNVKSTEQIVSLRMINQLGNIVTQINGSTIDVSSYAAGSYTIAILFSNNETVYQKLILSK